jgi:HEAT repeat protein
MPTLDFLLTELTCGNEARAEAASTQFKAHGEAAIDALADLFDNEDSDIRWWAIRTLATINHPTAREHLSPGLKDPDLTVQQCAALALRENPDPRIIPQLINHLGHKDRMLSRLCGDALIALGKEATQEILDVIEYGSLASRVEAARVLAATEDPISISSLFKLLDEESTFLRYWAEEGLNKMGVGMMFFKPE